MKELDSGLSFLRRQKGGRGKRNSKTLLLILSSRECALSPARATSVCRIAPKRPMGSVYVPTRAMPAGFDGMCNTFTLEFACSKNCGTGEEDGECMDIFTTLWTGTLKYMVEYPDEDEESGEYHHITSTSRMQLTHSLKAPGCNP
jgi:hypothetical protein